MTGTGTPRRILQAIALVALIALLQLGLAKPAAACSCRIGILESGELAEWVGSSEAIYVAEARLPDLAPGRSFRVERTLKGPPRHNLRVVMKGNPLTMLAPGNSGGADCSLTAFPPLTRYLIVGDPDDLSFSWCSRWAIGDEVVEQAIAQLGPGTEMPWRPDLLWLAQWVLLAAGAAFTLRGAWRRLRRRRGRAVTRHPGDVPRP